MNSQLPELKIRFEGALSELASYLPLLELMTSFSNENNIKNNFSLFTETIKDISLKSLNYFSENYSIDNIISDAKLYLTNDELFRFYDNIKRTFEFKKMLLINITNYLNTILTYTQEEINQTPLGFPKELETIFINNYTGGNLTLPIFGASPDKYFPTELVNSIEQIFNQFEDHINLIIKSPEYEIENNIKEIEKKDNNKIVSKLTNLQAIGYLFTELINKGIIEPRRRAGKESPQNIAKMILEHFHFEDLEEQPKVEDIRKTLFNDNKLSNDKMQLFKIPSLKQLNGK